MLKLRRKYSPAIMSVLVLALTGTGVLAQAPAGTGAPGGPGGRGNFDPAQFRQMMLDRFKEQLGATDDEWKVLQPRIEKVMTAQRESTAGLGGMAAMFGFGGRGGPGGGGGAPADANPSPLAKASQDLQEAIKDPNTDPKAYAKLMTTFREARDKARQQLADAKKDLKELLTAKQEALLLATGLVD